MYSFFSEQYAPPRAHHCFTCNKCILKRHNHCLFLGKCIGHNNFRFYLMFLVYIWFGAVFNTILNREYFLNNFTEFSLGSLLITFMPLLAWIIGMLSLKSFFFVFTNSVCLILSLLMFFYFIINFKMALNGQTWNERAKNINIYNLGWKQNLQEIFGTRWLVAAFNPFASNKLLNNGTSFRKSGEIWGQNLNENETLNNITSSPFSIPKRRNI